MLPRVFISNLPRSLAVGDPVKVEGELHHYLTRVMRLRPGDQFVALRLPEQPVDVPTVISDPFSLPVSQEEFLVRLESADDRRACGTIGQVNRARVEPDIRVTLGQALVRGNRFDYAVQKCTELGCFDVVPLVTERSEVRLSERREQKHVERWQRIAREAAEQSGRTHQPIVHPVMTMKEFTGFLPPDVPAGELRMIPWEEEQDRGIRSLVQGACHAHVRRAVLIIGPEGGLSEDEVRWARGAGFVPVTLGPRVLRTETAGAAALTMLLYQLGDLGGSI